MKNLTLAILCIFVMQATAQNAPNVTDTKGLKQGYWEKKDPQSGLTAYKGNFKDDKPVGTFTYYYPNMDSVHTIMKFTSNPKVAYATIYHTSGKIQAKGKYVDEKKDSVWTFYDFYGVLLSTETYKLGKREGKSYVYYPNGVISDEKYFENDKLTGQYKTYFENKAVKTECTYVNGKLFGKNATYYPGGVAAVMGYYSKSGHMNGLWVYKDEKGKVTKKEVYDEGKLLEGKAAEEWLLKNKNKTPEEPPKSNSGNQTKNNGSKKPVNKSTTKK